MKRIQNTCAALRRAQIHGAVRLYLGSVYKCTVKYILDKVSRILLHEIF